MMKKLQEHYLKNRPRKRFFSIKIQERLRDKAIETIKLKFLPDKKILKIILIGGSIKGAFGRYEKPGFRGSLYSDFDFIIFVKDNYKIPRWLRKEPDGKPFSDDKFNLAYRNKRFIDSKYDIEIFFIRESSLKNNEYIKQAKRAGIPLNPKSKFKQMMIFDSV